MPQGSRDDAKSCPLQDPAMFENVTDVYICVFFDGTGNNMYEQLNKKKKIAKRIEKDKYSSFSIQFSILPNLFSSQNVKKEIEKYGMAEYGAQREQAERDITISNDRNKNDNEGGEMHGGWKYSNVAVLRSLVRKMEQPLANGNSTLNNCINYNLYIEGSGQHWDAGFNLVGLGMGTGRTGVVGLVSKAIVFIREFLCSKFNNDLRNKIHLHFAVFGFSRGSTCGRLFSSLIVKDKSDSLGRESEFKQYLPQSKNYFCNNRITFLDDFSNKTVDFLGIYDTVSSIGFLQKKDNSTNYGLNNFRESPKDRDNKYIGFNEENVQQWYVNALHGSSLADSDALEIYTPAGPIPNPKVIGTFTSDKFWGDAKWNFHRFNVHDYGLDPYKYINKVKHTFHICAIDEFRENFALVDLGDKLNGCTEIYMPGCHSDIGGSYMYNDKIDEHTLRKVIGPDRLPAWMNYSMDPRSIIESPPLSQHVLFKMGWLNATTRSFSAIQNQDIPSMIGPVSVLATVEMEESTYKSPLKELDENTEGKTTYISQDSEKIDFRHFAKEGYSNISLQMMIDRVTGKYGLGKLYNWHQFMPFTNGNMPTRFKIKEGDKVLNSIATKCKSAVGKPEGKRYWVIPDNEEDYRYLRTNYLHFTCSDKIHKGADIGNAPNWLKKGKGYLLCRLVYRGNDDGDFDLHYWADCDSPFKSDEKI